MIDAMTVGVGILLWKAFRNKSDATFGVLTPEREEFFKNAMEFCKDPKGLEDYAKKFETHGLKAEAHWLRERARWRARPENVKRKHDEIYEKAMNSENIEGILDVAKIFESYTATIKAAALRERAKSLNALRNKAKPVVDAVAEAATKLKSEVERGERIVSKIQESMSGHTDPEEPKAAE